MKLIILIIIAIILFIHKLYSLSLILSLIGIFSLYYIYKENNIEKFCSNEVCGQSSDKLLPILEPRFNLREISKQMILLEDHLFNIRKRCKDCIIKHFLTIEALSEEAISLDVDKKFESILKTLPEDIRDLQKKWINKELSEEDIAQKIRKIRKPLMISQFNFVNQY